MTLPILRREDWVRAGLCSAPQRSTRETECASAASSRRAFDDELAGRTTNTRVEHVTAHECIRSDLQATGLTAQTSYNSRLKDAPLVVPS